MPRPLTGRILERRLMDDRCAFDVKIRERQMLVGYAPDWERRRVEHLLRTVLVPRATLNEAWWDKLAPSVADAPVRDRGVSFREAASEYVSRLQGQYSNAATLNAYISPVMKHIGPFFTYDGARERRVDEINGTLVSSFTATKMAERELLSNLAATLAELDDINKTQLLNRHAHDHMRRHIGSQVVAIALQVVAHHPGDDRSQRSVAHLEPRTRRHGARDPRRTDDGRRTDERQAPAAVMPDGDRHEPPPPRSVSGNRDDRAGAARRPTDHRRRRDLGGPQAILREAVVGSAERAGDGG
jgi:hypothetical protein